MTIKQKELSNSDEQSFILGSPRKDGNSETMAKAVAEGLLKTKITVWNSFIYMVSTSAPALAAVDARKLENA